MDSEWKLKLFIAGMSPGSLRAVENIKGICDTYLQDHFDLEVIDIYQQRHAVRDMNILAVPTLIRSFPEPEKRIIGDMMDMEKIVRDLEISLK